MTDKTLGNYKIVGAIGRGGMGVVYKATHPVMAKTVAIKVLPESFASNPTLVERFHREAKAMAGLKHENIVAIENMGSEGESYYIIMELVEGQSLRQLLSEKRTLPLSQALDIATQVCEALFYAHSKQVIHRDIKPGNILLDESGKAKVSDFGLARIVGDVALSVGNLDTAISQGTVGDRRTAGTRLTKEGTSPGTIDYMSPEQREAGEETDHRTDIYSFGVVLYEMITGRLPAGMESPSELRSEVPETVDEIVKKALASKIEKRYQNAEEFRKALIGEQAKIEKEIREKEKKEEIKKQAERKKKQEEKRRREEESKNKLREGENRTKEKIQRKGILTKSQQPQVIKRRKGEPVFAVLTVLAIIIILIMLSILAYYFVSDGHVWEKPVAVRKEKAKPVEVTRRKCSTCNGKGSILKTFWEEKRCSKCGGRGTVKSDTVSGPGFRIRSPLFKTDNTCPDCKGTGKTKYKVERFVKCSSCDGSGREQNK